MALSDHEIEAFRRDGMLIVEDAVTPAQLAGLRRDFAAWVEESRSHDAAYGAMVDGRPRFDLEPGHSAERPALRRVAAPADLSEAFYDVMADSRMTDVVADLIGPDLRLHHCKINSKLPGAATQVKWHQDFLYDPHSNTDLVTALLMLDDVTEENGPLEVVPGSHKGPLLSLWHDGVFTGAVADETAAALAGRTVSCTGPAGAVCLMHGCLLHGSAANRSDRPRTLFICVYAAADAVPLVANPVPGRHSGMIVRGREPNRIRTTPFEMEAPEHPKGASFFVQQAGHS
ncbi:MAG: phytanoyl-CoA dioxygenase family protein [Kiloniellales bacterium]|nr:phytanoyl-CoA dioxygenase family protein [Kiloniellales bacterium]